MRLLLIAFLAVLLAACNPTPDDPSAPDDPEVGAQDHYYVGGGWLGFTPMSITEFRPQGAPDYLCVYAGVSDDAGLSCFHKPKERTDQ